LQSSSSSASYSHTFSAQTTVSSTTETAAAARSVAAYPVAILDICKEDLDTLKKARYLGTSLTDSFLVTTSALTTDISVAENALTPLHNDGAQQALSHNADAASPSLLNFTLNMNTGVIDMDFDEVVDLATLDITQIMFQYNAFAGSNAQQYQLTSATVDSPPSPSRFAKITMSNTDMNGIKLKTGLCTSSSDCYVRFASSFVSDMAANAVTTIADGTAMQVHEHLADSTRPSILSFQLKSNGKMILKFSESMLQSSFNATAFLLHNADGSEQYRLSDLTVITNTELQDSKLTLTLNGDFSEAEKASVAMSQLTSYMSCTQEGFTDVAGNKLSAIALADGLLMGPALEEFTLDMQARNLTLVFSEALSGNVTAGAITFLSDAATSPGHFYTLTAWDQGGWGWKNATDGSYEVDTKTTVTLPLCDADVLALKKLGFLGVNKESTYISIGTSPPLAYNSDAASVGAPLFVVPIAYEDAIAATSYTKDSLSPTLTQYDIDKDSGVLTLTFSEPVTLSSFNATSFYVQKSIERGTSANYVQLDATTAVSAPNPLHTWVDEAGVGSEVVYLELTADDLGRVLSLDLGNFLVMASSGARDTSDLTYGNSIVAVPDGSAFSVTTVVPDSSGPGVESFTLNLETGRIVIKFSEPVVAALFDVSGVTIQGSNPASGTDSYTLTANTVILDDTGMYLDLDMNIYRVDLDGIKAAMLSGVAVDLASTLLCIDGTKFEDYSGNPGTTIADGSCITATSYVPDAEAPELLSFDLEHANAADALYQKMTLHFNEPIDPTSIVVANFVITDDASFSLSLANSLVNSATTASSIDVDLASAELSAIQGTGSTAFFLSIGADSAKDMSGNKLSAVNGQMLGPVLQFATVSMATGDEHISIIFSEDVDVDSFNPAGLTFANEDLSSTFSLLNSSLTAGSVLAGDHNIFTVRIGERDVKQLKLLQDLCVSAASCRVSVDGSMIDDLAGTPNPVVPVSLAQSEAVQGFTADKTAPTLLSVKIDISNDFFEFVFDEPIRADLVMMGQITFQDTILQSAQAASRTLVSTNYVGANNATIVCTLGFEDMVYIKSNANLCTNATSCFVSLQADTFVDTALSGNSAAIIYKSAARIVDTFVPDTVAPTLTSTDLNLDTGVLTLTFSEPVQLKLFQVSKVGIQKARNNPSEGLLLDAASATTQPDGHIVVVTLTVADLDFLLLNPALAVDRVTSYVSMEAAGVYDSGGNNSIAEISGFSAMQLTTYTADTTPPSLSSVTLDMNLGKLTMVFNEYLNIGFVDITKIGLFNATGGGATGVWLNGGSTLAQTSNHTKTLVVDFSRLDINNIKDLSNLAVTTSDSWVRILPATVTDMSGNLNLELDVFSLVQATTVVPDATSPGE